MKLLWPRQPSRTAHAILGKRLRWTDSTRQFRIERFPDDGNPVFCACYLDDDHYRPFSHHRTLSAAKHECDELRRKRK
jgi:hypothetical protein